MAKVTEVTLPDIGDFKDVEVIEVLVSPGDHIEAEDSLITLESDKASMEIPSPVAGTVKEMKVKVGDTINQGDPIAPAAAAGTGLSLPTMPEVDFSQFGEIEESELGRIKKISGKHLHRSWITVPHVTQFDEADITELEAFRKSMKAEAEKQEVRLTFMPFLMKACVAALQQFPQVNASLAPDGEKLILKKYFHIGVAVDTPNGLMVPVIRHVDEKGIYDLARELMEISSRAREGKLAPGDMQGGCFTISSLGGIGGTQFTPIVNAPEVAILGVSRAQTKPVWNGSEFEPRLIMPFSLSYDPLFNFPACRSFFKEKADEAGIRCRHGPDLWRGVAGLFHGRGPVLRFRHIRQGLPAVQDGKGGPA